MTRKQEGFTPKDIAQAANNTVVMALRPKTLEEIPPERLRKLRAYAMAVVEPCIEHVEEEFLRAEELVAILASATLYVQMRHVMQSAKLPMGPTTDELFKQAEDDLDEFNRKH